MDNSEPKEAVDMRSIEDQMDEIRRRSSLYREKKQISSLSLLAMAIGAMLMVVLMLALGVSGTVGKSSSLLGATILGPEAGGYVIAALLSFALGIIVTLITQKYRKTDEGLSSTGRTKKNEASG